MQGEEKRTVVLFSPARKRRSIGGDAHFRPQSRSEFHLTKSALGDSLVVSVKTSPPCKETNRLAQGRGALRVASKIGGHFHEDQ
jgi:hypothetical protein